MAMLTIRNLPDEVHRALRARAAGRGQSMEAEVREILEAAIRPQMQVKLGSLLVEVGRQARLDEDASQVFAPLRDKSPARLPSFE
ncbi:FitA-like ribbon-helix-helix domain-containing protein [Aquabacterium sp. OR-4]|uniref:FitA-like ribbon-helix-helix domain-containing protein n=1 Tax=Aquabacterium sp. OR-4 TaxID=2978127 RepID=UPI0021B419C9|nr:plasmid stabilization protein [Aquabacterium sp. OR-4]MDT7838153.1 plasmid stabilization protein [Aquabacterium sp. OR-4]